MKTAAGLQRVAGLLNLNSCRESDHLIQNGILDTYPDNIVWAIRTASRVQANPA